MADFVGGPVSRRKKGITKHLVMWKSKILKDGIVSQDRILVFIGGMEHPAEHGDLEATFRAELEEEAGLKLGERAPLTRVPVRAEHDGHVKHFVQVWRRDCTGSLRKVPIDDGETRLSVPFYADKVYLEKHLHGDYRLVLPYID